MLILTVIASIAGTAVAFGRNPALLRLVPLRPLSASKDDTADAGLPRIVAPKVGAASDAFLQNYFLSECDDVNLPPSLSIIHRSIARLESGSDIRGRFVDHPRRGSVAAVAKAIRNEYLPALTPFAAHCFGYAFATMLLDESKGNDVLLCVGRDPRIHGTSLADAFARGAEQATRTMEGTREQKFTQTTKVVFTGLATTPSMFEFCRSSLCDGGVMITASHLPGDRNGIKFFTTDGGFEKQQIRTLVALAQRRAAYWYDQATIPPTSGQEAVYCSEWVDFMPHYIDSLKDALRKEVYGNVPDVAKNDSAPLKGLKLVLNAGNGSGGFFKSILEDLGADVSGSINSEPDGNFPGGIPNPESASMIEQTVQACEAANADLGILLDTDADRCGLVAPRTIGAEGRLSNYEAINRNRLIALMGVIFARQSPGCTIVTCSVTSEGLAHFLKENLGLNHVRYLKGYANVINRARTLSESGQANAEVAIETSGHCALKENDYLDDGTYTAVKTIALLARERAKDPHASLLRLVDGMKEMAEVAEIRMSPTDGTLESNSRLYDNAALEIEAGCGVVPGWSLDQENLEGTRVSVGSDGSFFMLRKSLHDPVLSLQIEADSREKASAEIVRPILAMFEGESQIDSALDFTALKAYAAI